VPSEGVGVQIPLRHYPPQWISAERRWSVSRRLAQILPSAPKRLSGGPEVRVPHLPLPAGAGVRTGAALAASASRTATVRPRRGEGVVPWRIVMGIAREPRPQPPGECPDSPHGPRILLDSMRPSRSFRVAGRPWLPSWDAVDLRRGGAAWCSRAPSRRIRSSAVGARLGRVTGRDRVRSLGPSGGWLARAPECFWPSDILTAHPGPADDDYSGSLIRNTACRPYDRGSSVRITLIRTCAAPLTIDDRCGSGPRLGLGPT
jgi:hypothetical protein